MSCNKFPNKCASGIGNMSKNRPKFDLMPSHGFWSGRLNVASVENRTTDSLVLSKGGTSPVNMSFVVESTDFIASMKNFEKTLDDNPNIVVTNFALRVNGIPRSDLAALPPPSLQSDDWIIKFNTALQATQKPANFWHPASQESRSNPDTFINKWIDLKQKFKDRINNATIWLWGYTDSSLGFGESGHHAGTDDVDYFLNDFIPLCCFAQLLQTWTAKGQDYEIDQEFGVLCGDADTGMINFSKENIYKLMKAVVENPKLPTFNGGCRVAFVPGYVAIGEVESGVKEFFDDGNIIWQQIYDNGQIIPPINPETNTPDAKGIVSQMFPYYKRLIPSSDPNEQAINNIIKSYGWGKMFSIARGHEGGAVNDNYAAGCDPSNSSCLASTSQISGVITEILGKGASNNFAVWVPTDLSNKSGSTAWLKP